MTRNTLHTATRALMLAAAAGIAVLGLVCGQSTASEAAAPPTPEAAPAPAAPSPQRAAAPASAPTHTARPAAAPSPGELTFTGDACFTGGCMRPIHENGCGGMDESQVL